jgi:hypothetical protein
MPACFFSNDMAYLLNQARQMSSKIFFKNKKGILADAFMKINQVKPGSGEAKANVGGRSGGRGCVSGLVLAPAALVGRIFQPAHNQSGRGHLLTAAVTQQDIAAAGHVSGGMQFHGECRRIAGGVDA